MAHTWKQLFDQWFEDQDNDDKFTEMVQFACQHKLWNAFLLEHAQAWLQATKPEERMIRRICISNLLRFEHEVEENQLAVSEEVPAHQAVEVHLTDKEKLARLNAVLCELVHVHRIDQYATIVPLKLSCRTCNQAFIQGDVDSVHCPECMKLIWKRPREHVDDQIVNDEEDEEPEEVKVSFQGRAGPKKSCITGIAYRPPNGGLHLRLDDENNLDFWAEGYFTSEECQKLLGK
jgi:hypothetical protein